jgi:hypothetical protein
VTDVDGKRRHVFASRLHQTVLVATSAFPIFMAARNILNFCMHEAGSGRLTDAKLLDLLEDLAVSLPPPVPGIRLNISCPGEGDVPVSVAQVSWRLDRLV